MRSFVWFRSDLRTIDNPALHDAALASKDGVVGVFVITPVQWAAHDWGVNKIDFTLRNLAALSTELSKLNIPLKILTTPTFKEIPQQLLNLAVKTKCTSLYFNREHEVNELQRDQQVTKLFTKHNLNVRPLHDQTIIPPDLPRTQSGNYYTVFTPFKKIWLSLYSEGEPVRVLPKPKKLNPIEISPDSVPSSIQSIQSPLIDISLWPAGEIHAQKRLKEFQQKRIADYANQRDFPATTGTSTISPYLASGVISIRQCMLAAIETNPDKLLSLPPGPSTWLSELIWREFYRHVLVGFPRVCKNKNFKPTADKIKWKNNRDQFNAWCTGQTGYPIIDAAIRQLLNTGWMHNRLRMVTAMFLVKDLLVDWRWGEQFFVQHLIDADFASNNGGWQWAASTGTDAVPYFRIFNPASQSKRFDPQAEFVYKYCPELSSLSPKQIHNIEKLPPLARASLDYPELIVNHAIARLNTIEVYKKALST